LNIHSISDAAIMGVGSKFSRDGGIGKKQDQKIASLSLPILYHYHVWKSRGGHDPLCRRPWPQLQQNSRFLVIFHKKMCFYKKAEPAHYQLTHAAQGWNYQLVINNLNDGVFLLFFYRISICLYIFTTDFQPWL